MSLSTDQQNAADMFMKFILGKENKEMGLFGHSGTGKTFVTKYMIEAAHKAKKLLNLLTGDDDTVNIHCTATTNKAAGVIAQAIGGDAQTIHSLLGLKVFNNYQNGTTSLQKTREFEPLRNTILFIDEASMENKHLLDLIRESTPDCKVLHILDPYQLLPVYENSCPVADHVKYRAVLQTAQRFGSNTAIPELGEGYRKCIDILKAIPPDLIMLDKNEYNKRVREAFPKLEPHGKQIQLVNGATFRNKVIAQFEKINLNPNEAKIVAWTNSKVSSYNSFVRRLHTSSDKFLVDEIVMTNKPIPTGKSGIALSTDSVCTITEIDDDISRNFCDIHGWNAIVNNSIQIFIPCNQQDVKRTLGKESTKARINRDWTDFFRIKEQCADLRPVYASTVHKSQGSTYQKIFVDLPDIGNNANPEEVARLLYVGTTRPSDEVILYGRLPSKYGG